MCWSICDRDSRRLRHPYYQSLSFQEPVFQTRQPRANATAPSNDAYIHRQTTLVKPSKPADSTPFIQATFSIRYATCSSRLSIFIPPHPACSTRRAAQMRETFRQLLGRWHRRDLERLKRLVSSARRCRRALRSISGLAFLVRLRQGLF